MSDGRSGSVSLRVPAARDYTAGRGMYLSIEVHPTFNPTVGYA